jgi:hypothetical protein
MRKVIAGGFILVLFLCCLGCSHVGSYLDIVKDKGISNEYLDNLKKWTRSETVYSQFETKVHIGATYKSGDFNAAYRKEYARVYNLSAQEIKTREELSADLSSDLTEFFFYAYLPEKNNNDFDKYNSIWKVYLIDAQGNRFEPMEIRRIEKITPLIEEFYPYIQQYYGSCYTLKFPALSAEAKAAGPFKLAFTGVLGRVELIWEEPSR